MAAAILVYGTGGAAFVAATATARHVVEEELTQVELVTSLPPEPPPAEVAAPEPAAPQPAPAPATPRPKIKRQELAPPDEIPSEKPPESDAPLAEASGPAGEGGGVLGGASGGTGTAAAVAPPPPAPAPPPPAPKAPEPLVPPVELADNAKPKYSLLAKRNGIEGVVVVTFEVLENGRVASPRIMSGPEELHEPVLKAVAGWRFQPARRGHTAVRHKLTRQVRFRLEDA